MKAHWLNSWQEYVMGALSGKTVLLVTHQVDFLPAFDCVLVSWPIGSCCFLYMKIGSTTKIELKSSFATSICLHTPIPSIADVIQ